MAKRTKSIPSAWAAGQAACRPNEGAVINYTSLKGDRKNETQKMSLVWKKTKGRK
jgi:hypothetical protein